MVANAQGEVVADDQGIARVFAEHYESVCDTTKFAHDAGFDDTHFHHVEEEVKNFQESVSYIDEGADVSLNACITADELEVALKQLKNNSVGSPHDGITNELLKHGGGALDKMLLSFVNMQWDMEVKHQTPGVITSIHKGGDKLDPNNYRPITLNAVIDKLYNRIINNRIMAHLENNALLHEGQNGFRWKRDCAQHIFTLHTVLQGRKQEGKTSYLFLLDVMKAYDTVWRAGCLWHAWQAGVRGKMFRVLCQLYDNTCSQVMQNGTMSDGFTSSMGLPQGDTLSPTMFALFINSVLSEVWEKHAGVPLPGTEIGKLVALMFADDFIGVTESEEALQAMADIVSSHLTKWRLKANIPKSAVLVVEPTPSRNTRRTRQPQQPNILWGGELVPIKDSYKYLGVMLHNSLKWDQHIKYVCDKALKSAKALYPILANRRMSMEVKRTILLTLIRPIGEHAAQVWNPLTVVDRNKLDSMQMDIVKSAVHCASTTSHIALQQEWGIRPLSCWTDKRMLEFWYNLQHMSLSRLPKQVLQMQWGRVGSGRVPATWQKKVKYLFESYRIDPVVAVTLKYEAFKKQFHKQMVVAQTTILQEATTKSTVVRNYVNRFGGSIQYAGPQGYLKSGSCGKGRELVMQLRVQSLPLKALTGKFDKSRSRSDAKFCCPVCHGGSETAQHFLIDCPAYDTLRVELFDALANINSTKFMDFSYLSSEEKSWELINNTFWMSDVDKGGVKAILAVAAYTFEAWKMRNANTVENPALQNLQHDIDEVEEDDEMDTVGSQHHRASTSSAMRLRSMLRVADGNIPGAA
jgi:hypothetical protein